MKSTGQTVQSGCSYFVKSRQGYYDRITYERKYKQFKQSILQNVKRIREDLPQCGVRKLQYLLYKDGIKIGRDRLFKLLKEENLLIRRKRKYTFTTNSGHSLTSYDNLLKEIEINHAEEVFVSDMTYIRTNDGFCYLAIVGDAYSKKIMGKYLGKDMQTTIILKALVSALRNRQYNRSLIHHSDQGSQYCSRTYVNALKLSDIMISMAGKGKAWENPVAERMIGILKYEYGLNRTFKTFEEADLAIETAIKSYNKFRPHLSCGYLTPEQAHEKGKNLDNLWKKKLSTPVRLLERYSQKERKEAKERKNTTTTTTVKYI